MELPNATSVEVSRDKVVEYLLNPGHPDGAGKAAFFREAGFRVERWEEFADALKSLANQAPVMRSMESTHGSKYIIDGPINTPSGDVTHVRSVWIIDCGRLAPRLVTAYPLRQGMQ